MTDTFLPLVSNNAGSTDAPPRPTRTPRPTPRPTRTPTPTATPPGSQRVVVDPLTRIEGHLRIEAQVSNGQIVDAWSAGTMFRGIEPILIGRDPRDAWIFAERICGVCTTVHAIASVRAVENALGITIPDNARIIRNLLEAAQYVQDHVMHFYHLHALDWVDIVNALSADPTATSNLQKSISTWPNNSPEYFAIVRARLKAVVDSGQLGLFANGYWGHPAYKLPPEGNLLAAAHFLEALDWQREFIRIHAILGGKSPHPQTYLVGGVATPVDKTSAAAINPTKIATLKTLAAAALDFVGRVYLPDLRLIASFYPEWASLGGGVGNFLSFGDFPTSPAGVASYYLPQGVVYGKSLSGPVVALDQNLIKEYVAHSWFSYTGGDNTGLHPSQGQTIPNYTGPMPPYDLLNVEGKYSWLKTPRYNEVAVEVGPLARVVVAYAAGHARIRELVNSTFAALGLDPNIAIFSTIGRVAARGIETLALAEQIDGWLTALLNNINAGNLKIADTTRWNTSTWPAQAQGWGTTEAPRGALGHWLHISNQKIDRYQNIVATQWNASPRDAAGQRGAYEQSLIGTPLVDPARPIEILRTIHSFDPCMACAVHMVDATGADLGEATTGLDLNVR